MKQPWLSRAYNTLCLCWQYCPPRSWLLLYYPLAYFEDVADKILLPVNGRSKYVQTICLLILPLLYMFLRRHRLMDVDLWVSRKSTTAQSEHMPPHGEEPLRSRDLVTLDELMNTSLEHGLDNDKVTARQEVYGNNEVWKGTSWKKLVWQFSIEPAHILIEAATAIAVANHDWPHTFLLGVLLTLTFRAESESTRSVDDVIKSIATDSSTLAVVLRNGLLMEIAAKDLVPGDIVHVSEGSRVPADGRVVSLDDELYLDQSAITGEHLPVRKYQGDVCYTDTGVLRGSAFLITVYTGKDTFLGRTISVVQNEQPRYRASEVNAIPRHVAEYDTALRAIGASIFALVTVSYSLDHIMRSSVIPSTQILRLVASMSIAVIRFLPSTGVNAYRAIGASELSQHACIAQSPDVVESLAGIDILCCDKTGTVTENRPILLEPCGISCDPDAVILTGALTSTPDKNSMDPIDRAVLKALRYFPQAKANADRHRILEYQPFDLESKTMRALVEAPNGEHILCAKGAPKAILELCLRDNPSIASFRESYVALVRRYVHCGHRCLGVARKCGSKEWELLGILPMYDPPRGDTAGALRLAKELSISVKLITGDAAIIAEKFCESIGMGSNVLNTDDIFDEQQLSAERIESILGAQAYAEVSPENKQRILKTLQCHGHFVAMTGDGIVEAPLLRRADCGIAISGATETAQSASDVVFTKPGLWLIIQAIQASRQVFQQNHNHIVQRLTLLLHVLFIMLWHCFYFADVFSLRVPILTTQVSDFIMAICRTRSQDLPFSRQPVRWSYRRLLKETLPLVAVLFLGCLICMLVVVGQPQATNTTTFSIRLGRKPGPLLNQALTLYIIVSDHLMGCLVHTDGRFWMYKQHTKALRSLLCFDIAVTLFFHSGWTGRGYHLSVAILCRIWIVCVCTFCAAAALRYATFEGQLMTRHIAKEKNA